MKINNIPIKIITESKFKDIMIRFCFFNSYNKNNITSYALLSYILVAACKKYNTKKKKLDAISNIYNAEITFSTHSIYETRASYLTLRMINYKYTYDNDLLDKGIDILYEFLLNPYIQDIKGTKSFNKRIFAEAKQFIIDEINKEYDEKESYALRRVLINMFPDEIFSLNPLGSKEELEKITPESLYLTYLDLINNSKKIIFAIGDCFANFDVKLSKFHNLYSQNDQLNKIIYDNSSTKYPHKEQLIAEKANIKQAILILAYQTNISVMDREYDALQIFVDMLGGHFLSNLFQVVREQNGLCYSIESCLLSSEKIVIIKAGIDKNNANKTIALIKQEINKYQTGIIDKDLFKIIKQEYLDSLEENRDTFGGIFGIELDHYLFDIPNDIDVLKKRINDITIEDVKNVSKMLSLKITYLLSE